MQEINILPPDNTSKKLLFIIIGLLLAIGVMGSLSSCNSKHYARKYMAQLEKTKGKCNANPDAKVQEVPAQFCATNYPIKPFTKTIYKYKAGKRDTVTQHDTVQADCPDGTIVSVPCPPTRTITEHDTMLIHDTTLAENTAVTEALHYELAGAYDSVSNYRSKLTKSQESTKECRKWALWEGGILVLLVLGRIGYQVIKNQYAKKAKAVKDLIG